MILSRPSRRLWIALCLMLGMVSAGLWICPMVRADDPPPPADSSTTRHTTTFSYFPLLLNGTDTHLPLIQVLLNDKTTATFLVDTGSRNSVITDALAKQLGIPAQPIPAAEKNHMMDKAMTEYVLTDLQVGDVKLPQVPVAILKADRFAQLGPSVDGILGNNVMSQVQVLFDFAQHQITLAVPAGTTADDLKQMDMADAAVLPLTDPSNQYQDRVPVELNGGLKKVEESMVVDTGAITTLISPASAQQVGLTPIHGTPAITGFLSVPSVDMGEVSLITLGGSSSTNVSVDYPVDKEADHVPFLGMDVLVNCRVLLDYTGKKMYVKPNAPITPVAAASPSTASPTPGKTAAMADAKADDPAVTRYHATVAYFPMMENGVDTHLPLVQVRLNGTTTATFIVDTGFPISVITDTLAKKLGTKTQPIDPRVLDDLDDKDIKDLVPTTIHFGDFDLPETPLVIYNQERFSFFSSPIDGILGNNVMKGYSVLFDFAKHQITITWPGSVTTGDLTQMDMTDAIVVPITDPGQQFRDIVHVQISNGTKNTEDDLMVDTGGMNTTALVSSTTAQQLGLTPDGPAQGANSFQGGQPMYEGNATTLTLGPIVLTNPKIVYPAGKGLVVPTLLGLDFLSNYRVLLDYTDGKMYLKPNAPPAASTTPPAAPAGK